MDGFRRHYYLLSALAALEPMGSVPPMSKLEFFEQVIDSNGPAETVEMILLSDDLVQYESLLAEDIEPDRTDMAVLSIDKTDNEAILPDFLLPEDQTDEQENKRMFSDSLWSRFFHHAASIAKSRQSSFLKAWIGFEVGLRNALVEARAQVLELDSAGYLVASQLADNDTDYSFIISAWSAASNPLAAMEALDKARWEWLEERGKWYSFSACEIEVYAARLVLLHRWRRILSEKQQRNVSNFKAN